jgi:hypothetical protein
MGVDWPCRALERKGNPLSTTPISFYAIEGRYKRRGGGPGMVRQLLRKLGRQR